LNGYRLFRFSSVEKMFAREQSLYGSVGKECLRWSHIMNVACDMPAR